MGKSVANLVQAGAVLGHNPKEVACLVLVLNLG